MKQFSLTDRTKILLSLILIIFAGFISYSNTLRNEFVYDDIPVIVENTVIKHLTAGNLVNIWDINPTRILPHLTFALNYRFGGLNVTGFHLVNLLLHLFNALLVYLFIRLLQKSPVLSKSPLSKSFLFPLLVSLLFTVHPVQTQAVTYIVQRATIIFTSFYLCALIFYFSFRLQKGKPLKSLLFFLGTCIFSVLSYLSKEPSYTLPVIVALADWYFFTEKKSSSLIRKIGRMIPVVVLSSVTVISYLTIRIPLSQDSHTRMELLSRPPSYTLPNTISRTGYLYTEINVLRTYLRVLALPVNQNIDPDYPVSKNFFEFPVVISFVFLLSLLTFSVLIIDRLPVVSFGILFFFITLSLESSFFPIPDVYAEHRLYLPSIGIFMGIVGALVIFLQKKGRNLAPVILWIITLIFLLLMFATYRRNAVWRDAVSLWTDTVNKSPYKSRPHANLGSALFQKGNISQALSEEQTAQKLDPTFDMPYNNLGAIYQNIGKMDLARQEYESLLSQAPFLVLPRQNLASLLLDEGKLDEAVFQYRYILKENPAYAQAHNDLGVIYYQQGKKDEAQTEFKKAIYYDPDLDEAYFNLGSVMYLEKDTANAGMLYRKTLEVNPNYAKAYSKLGLLSLSEGKTDQARLYFQQALKIQPDLAEAKENLEKLGN